MSSNATMNSDNSSRGDQAIVTSVVFVTLASIIVVLRLVTRFSIVQNVGAEDWLVTIALVSIFLTISFESAQ